MVYDFTEGFPLRSIISSVAASARAALLAATAFFFEALLFVAAGGRDTAATKRVFKTRLCGKKIEKRGEGLLRCSNVRLRRR